MSEGRHFWGCGKGVGDLGNASIPAANIGDISGFREGANGVNKIISGFDGVRGDGSSGCGPDGSSFGTGVYCCPYEDKR